MNCQAVFRNLQGYKLTSVSRQPFRIRLQNSNLYAALAKRSTHRPAPATIGATTIDLMGYAGVADAADSPFKELAINEIAEGVSRPPEPPHNAFICSQRRSVVTVTFMVH